MGKDFLTVRRGGLIFQITRINNWRNWFNSRNWRSSIFLVLACPG